MDDHTSIIDKIVSSISQTRDSKTLSKGDILLAEGNVERNLYYVEAGAIRVFFLTEYEEQTIRFGYKGSLINSLSSFISEKPSEFYIDAIRKSTVRIMNKDSFLKLVYEDEQSIKQYITLLQILLTQQVDREIDLLITSPLERLQRVLRRSPNLFQEIPLKYIASYLRMTPETLSRIRNS